MDGELLQDDFIVGESPSLDPHTIAKSQNDVIDISEEQNDFNQGIHDCTYEEPSLNQENVSPIQEGRASRYSQISSQRMKNHSIKRKVSEYRLNGINARTSFLYGLGESIDARENKSIMSGDS